MSANTTTTVTHFRSRNNLSWELCYPQHVESSLRDGYRVKKLTVTRTYEEEFMGAEGD